MRTTIFFALFVIGVLLHSCVLEKAIYQKSPANNDTYLVEYLFEHDGCKVYRFRDSGHYVYFTNCTGEVTNFTSDTTDARITNVIRKVSPEPDGKE